jgi:hypothetical protein
MYIFHEYGLRCDWLRLSSLTCNFLDCMISGWHRLSMLSNLTQTVGYFESLQVFFYNLPIGIFHGGRSLPNLFKFVSYSFPSAVFARSHVLRISGIWSKPSIFTCSFVLKRGNRGCKLASYNIAITRNAPFAATYSIPIFLYPFQNVIFTETWRGFVRVTDKKRGSSFHLYSCV